MPQIQISSILYPTDFSPTCSAAALPYARYLAEALGVPLDVIYVHDRVEDQDAEHAVLSRRLKNYLDAHDLSNVVRSALIAYGSPEVEILKAAEETSAGIIVMGTRGRSGLSTMFVGSVTQHVIKQAHCPVFVVGKETVKTVPDMETRVLSKKPEPGAGQEGV